MKTNSTTATLRHDSLPKPEKVCAAKTIAGAALKAAKKQYEGSTIPTRD